MRTAIVSAIIAAVVAIILFLGAGDETGPNAFIVIGFTSGAAYGLVAIGLVLVYKGTRVFNFAQGEFGSIAAFIVFVLMEQVTSPEIPYGVAIAIAIAAAAVIGLVMERIVVRPLLNAPKITLLVATIAFTLLAIGIQILLFLPEVKSLQPIIQPLSGGEKAGVTIFDYHIVPQRLLIMAVLLGLAALLAYFFSKTDLGLAVLATSQDAFATRVVGIGVERMSRFIWVAAAMLGAIAGILYVPVIGILAPGIMTASILIPAFTGAVIGGMTSLPGAFIGGTVVGLVQQLAAWASINYSPFGEPLQDTIPGTSDVALVAVLLIVLLARPQGLLGSEA
jgi:branched-chain amino acid transport system permease protein